MNHDFDAAGVCVTCGKTRGQVAVSGAACVVETPAAEPPPDPFPPVPPMPPLSSVLPQPVAKANMPTIWYGSGADRPTAGDVEHYRSARAHHGGCSCACCGRVRRHRGT